MADNQDKAKSARAQIIHRHLQRKFEQHREVLEAHKEKGGVFRVAVEELERKLFAANVPTEVTEAVKSAEEHT